jgi:uncharacterized protein (UPF0332 family)
MTSGAKFNWADYVNVAQDLLNSTISNNADPSAQAKLRSAISRAYYAAFCRARNYLRDIEGDPALNSPPKDGFNPHWYVIDNLKDRKNPQQQSLVKVGSILDRLRTKRNNADYDDALFNVLVLAKASVSDAKHAIQCLDSFIQKNHRP